MPAGSPDADEVISASRSVPDPRHQDEAGHRSPAPAGQAAGKRQQLIPARGRGNVLAFPEPRGKRRRRRLLVVVCTAVALVAALLAGAVYSPVLALRTISVSGTHC